MLVAGLSAYATIALFLGILDRIGLMPFVWYRLILGCGLVVVIILS
jgi:undecaprenyl-diphosphatase